MEIISTAAFLRAAKKLPANRLDEADAAVELLQGSFGHPHRHQGLGIRQLKPHYFELRAGLDLRVLFTLSGGRLYLRTVGNHDHIRAWLKENA